MINKKIEALQSAAAQKASESALRVDKAIEKMIKQGQIITFKSVATAANVSTAYLYKQTDLRNRIECLRDQQKQQQRQPTIASENSKATIISTLRSENKNLRAEIDGLRRINEGLTGRIYQLQGAEDLAERIKAENAQLIQQLLECRQQAQEIKVLPIDNLKVNTQENKIVGRLNINQQVQQQLDSLGIQLNKTLLQTIQTASESTVLDAIEAFKEALTDNDISKPGAWLKKAIEQAWKPNGKIHSKPQLEIFDEWYLKAKQKRLILASQTTKDGILIYTKDEQWIPFSEMLIRYPLETL
jgi:Family of unknown function (DUF6262)